MNKIILIAFIIFINFYNINNNVNGYVWLRMISSPCTYSSTACQDFPWYSCEKCDSKCKTKGFFYGTCGPIEKCRCHCAHA